MKVVQVLLDSRLSIPMVVAVVKAEVVLLLHQKLAEVDICTSFFDIWDDPNRHCLVKKVWRDQLMMISLLRSIV